MRKMTLAAAAIVFLGWSPPAQAKEGLSLGIGLGASGFVGKDLRDAIDPGPAGTISLEFGLTDSLSIRGAMSGSVHTGKALGTSGAATTTDWLRGFRLGPTFYFRPESALRPFVEIGVGVYGLSSSQGFSMMSSNRNSSWDTLVSWGVDLGTGFEYSLRKEVSVGFRLGYLFIAYPATTIDGRNTFLRGDALSGLFTVSYHFKGMMMHMMHMGHGSEEHEHEEGGAQ